MVTLSVTRDRPKRLFLVTAVTETGAEIQLLVSAVTVTRPFLSIFAFLIASSVAWK